MLVAMPLPLTDMFRDGVFPWESCVDLASRDPLRTVFWGSVNSLEGRKALDEMERQVGEFGARAFNFYNIRYAYGSPYPRRMDDPQVAFSVFEKARDLFAQGHDPGDERVRLSFPAGQDAAQELVLELKADSGVAFDEAF